MASPPAIDRLYELPFGRRQRLLPDVSRLVGKAINGWEVSVIAYRQTAYHLTPGITIPDPKPSVARPL